MPATRPPEIQRLTSANRTHRTKWTRETDWQRMVKNDREEQKYEERYNRILAQLIEEYQRTGMVPK